MQDLGDKTAFEKVFREHYAELCKITYPILHDTDAAEDVVHDVFLKLWENRHKLEVEKTLKGYLYKAVVYSSLDYMKKQKRSPSLEVVKTEPVQETEPSQSMETKELKAIVKEAVNHLPERCRAVFTLSRYNDMKNMEIAEFLGISVKTVENQMTKALKMMRDYLKERTGEIGVLWLAVNFFDKWL